MDCTWCIFLNIVFLQLLQASYSFYTWPSAPVLAWFLWENRAAIINKNILEIGSGTALPGILAAKCGANVTLSDSVTLPKSLAHIQRSCVLNNLKLDENIRLIGLTWGLFLNNFESLGPIDYILGSDCFYDPTIFEDILVSVAYVLDLNPGAKFLCTYQERSSDWTIEPLLDKWQLKCQVHSIADLGANAGFDIHKLIGDHCIQLIEICR